MAGKLRCPQCRSRRATLVSLQRHIADTGHKQCNCGGYEHPHRPNSPYCHKNYKSILLHAARDAPEGTDLLQLAADWAWDFPGLPSSFIDPPF